MRSSEESSGIGLQRCCSPCSWHLPTHEMHSQSRSCARANTWSHGVGYPLPATITIQRETSDVTSESETGSLEKRSTAPRSKVNGFRCVHLSSRSLWSTEYSQRSRSFREYRSMLRSFRQIPFPMCVCVGGVLGSKLRSSGASSTPLPSPAQPLGISWDPC